MNAAELRAQLDRLQPDASGAVRGEFQFHGRPFFASFDPAPPSIVEPNAARAALLASILSRVPESIERCADDLLEVYNSAWADEDPDEGTPPMDREAFMGSLSLSSVLVVDDFSATIVFDAGDLFAGHFVTLSLDRALNVHGRASLWG